MAPLERLGSSDLPRAGHGVSVSVYGVRAADKPAKCGRALVLPGRTKASRGVTRGRCEPKGGWWTRGAAAGATGLRVSSGYILEKPLPRPSILYSICEISCIGVLGTMMPDYYLSPLQFVLHMYITS